VKEITTASKTISLIRAQPLSFRISNAHALILFASYYS